MIAENRKEVYDAARECIFAFEGVAGHGEMVSPALASLRSGAEDLDDARWAADLAESGYVMADFLEGFRNHHAIPEEAKTRLSGCLAHFADVLKEFTQSLT